jgi:hypothetical protein
MKSAMTSVLASRTLGYGGPLVLTVIALGILVDTFVQGGGGGGQAPAAAGTRQAPTAPATAELPTVAPSEPVTGPTRPSVTRQPGPRNTAFNRARTRPIRCSPRSAIYERAGDTVKVTVNFPGNGYVAAFIELEGRDTMTKSATNVGQPQSFMFTGAPASITRRIGVTVITQMRMETCDVPQKR